MIHAGLPEGHEVWQALARSRPEKSFEAWCYGVLRHHLLDRLRTDQREQARRMNWTLRVETPDLQEALERALDQQNPLPATDLITLRGWPLPQRVMLLSWLGLWEKVPAEQWRAWVVEYRTTRDSALPDPFPPEELRGCDDKDERLAILCRALQMEGNTLSAWLRRYKRRLRELYYLRGQLDA
jgi:hypothetical protein